MVRRGGTGQPLSLQTRKAFFPSAENSP